MIFDNADSIDKEDLFEEFWPDGHYGSVLITSRDTALQKSVGGEVLAGLTTDSAVELLTKLTKSDWQEESESEGHSGHEEDAAYGIVARVGCLPLGIIQASQVIVNDECLLTDFLEAYNDRELIESANLVKLVKRPGEKYSLNLSTVWNMSFDTLGAEQQQLLNVLSCLDPDRIQLQLLSEGAARAVDQGMASLAFMDSVRKLNKCKGPIVRSSLVTQNEKLRELLMHRLVQRSCHLRMSPDVRQATFNMAYWIVKCMWPVPPRENRHSVHLWPTQQAYFAHVQSLSKLYSDSQTEEYPLQAEPGFAELICDASLYVRTQVGQGMLTNRLAMPTRVAFLDPYFNCYRLLKTTACATITAN